MKLLVIGSGGREHAIAKKLMLSPLVETVYCAKGNPGMAQDGITLVDIAENDHQGLIQFVKDNNIAWTFVGPEIPLFEGVTDAFEAAGLKVFGPSKKAADLECSKQFAKDLMKKYGIPTAAYETFEDYEAAVAYVEANGVPIVIKADGLAAGKGVVVAMTMTEALDALNDMLLQGKYAAGKPKVVIEEYLEGEEFSLFALANGAKYYYSGVAQDHKRAYDGDKGPNTGGMGAYSPVPQVSEAMIQEVLDTVVKPTVEAMVAEGIPFKGVVYAGLMITAKGLRVIEFNARFGDPETQVIMNQMASDLAQVIDDILNGKDPVIEMHTDRYTLGVVVAAEGYPEAPMKDIPLPDLDKENADCIVYAAGVKAGEQGLLSNGGRILLIAGQGETLQAAQDKAYRYLSANPIAHTFYRSDIGAKAIRFTEK